MNTRAQTATIADSVPSTEPLSRADLSRLAQQTGFALLRDGATWRVYREPEQFLAATDIPSLQKILVQVQQHLEQGGESVGILNYELGYALEPRLFPLSGRRSSPLCWFGLYSSAEVWDISFAEEPTNDLFESSHISLSRGGYLANIETIRQLIEAGEVYQVNFTTRVCLTLQRSAWETFETLFRRNPVPYAAFLNTGDAQILSLSPEMFFKIEDGHITVKPMKGTAPRGRFLQEDLLVAEQLHHSEKNRAENVMIVDVMRNDLGRICRTGSVKTTKIFDVERFPSVWQMTSTIEGELLKDCTMESILTTLFPSGSVTGAPKIRAMEHIANLEESPRGVYTGAIGFLTPERSVFNVAIRTLELQGERGQMGTGGGITYDSEPSAEWEECHWKTAFLTDIPRDFKIIETMYWEREYRLLDAHLARMRDSAEYFGFKFSEQLIRSELAELATRFLLKPKRVRIVLDQEGEFEITHADFIRSGCGRVGISDHAVDSQDRFLFHKTTNRGTYEQALTAARKLELDDFLFFNERSELTEGSIHNVFVVKDGIWRTPAVTCGLLPGTFRAHILKQRPDCSEAVVHLDDLKRADSIYLCNSVRGIFPVKVNWNAGGNRP